MRAIPPHGEIHTFGPCQYVPSVLSPVTALAKEQCSFGNFIGRLLRVRAQTRFMQPATSVLPSPSAHVQNKCSVAPGTGCPRDVPSLHCPHPQGKPFSFSLPFVRQASWSHIMRKSKQCAHLGTNPGGQLGISSLLTNTNAQR